MLDADNGPPLCLADGARGRRPERAGWGSSVLVFRCWWMKNESVRRRERDRLSRIEDSTCLDLSFRVERVRGRAGGFPDGAQTKLPGSRRVVIQQSPRQPSSRF